MDCTHGRVVQLQQFMESCCCLWDELTLERVVENCLLWEGPQAGVGEGLLFLSTGRKNM